MKKTIAWLEAHQLPCFYKHYLGTECPGCGMQSAIIFLLKGEILESIKTYPALLPIILLIGFLVFHLVYRSRRGAVILKYMFIFTVIVQVTSYLIKLSDKYF